MQNFELAEIVDIVLCESSSTLQLTQALDAYLKICSQISGIDAKPCFDAWAKDSYLDSGLAISPEAAANCVTDYKRSIVFIRGVYHAIKAIQKKFKHHKLNILYAGCGPFATQILPLLAKFKTTDFKLTLLDIHQDSLDSVRLLVQYFQLDKYDISLEMEDACHYQPKGRQHVILTETMQKALEQEPQYQITKNLTPYLVTGGTFLPEKVQVSLCLIKIDKEKKTFEQFQLLDIDELILQKQRYFLGPVIDLGLKKIDDKFENRVDNIDDKKTCSVPYQLSCGEFELPENEQLESFDLALMTNIQVYQHYRLNDYESELTLPAVCTGLPTLKQGMKLSIQYFVGSYPKFEVSVD